MKCLRYVDKSTKIYIVLSTVLVFVISMFALYFMVSNKNFHHMTCMIFGGFELAILCSMGAHAGYEMARNCCVGFLDNSSKVVRWRRVLIVFFIVVVVNEGIFTLAMFDVPFFNLYSEDIETRLMTTEILAITSFGVSVINTLFGFISGIVTMTWVDGWDNLWHNMKSYE